MYKKITWFIRKEAQEATREACRQVEREREIKKHDAKKEKASRFLFYFFVKKYTTTDLCTTVVREEGKDDDKKRGQR